MAQDNQVSAILNQTDLDEIRSAVELIQSKLTFLVNLTPLERQTYSKMGDKTVAFVQKSLEHAKENQNLVPPFMNLDEFKKDMNLIRNLSKVLRPINQLSEGLDDTIMLAGHESYQAALIFYNSVKMARKMNIHGVDSVYDDLKERFPGRGSNETEVEVTEDNTEEENTEVLV